MVSDYTIDHIPIELEMMPDSSRVWIFQAAEPLSDRQVLQANEYLRTFTLEWQSHGAALSAFGGVFYKRFVVICLDEDGSASASGCSIDNMTHHIQHLGTQVSTDLMERQSFYFQMPDGSIDKIGMHEVSTAKENGRITEDTPVFDTLIKTKADFYSKFLVPVGQSWHKRFL